MCENNKYDVNCFFDIFIWIQNKIYTLQRIVLDKEDKRFVQFKNPCNYWLLFPSVVKCILVLVTGLKKLQT